SCSSITWTDPSSQKGAREETSAMVALKHRRIESGGDNLRLRSVCLSKLIHRFDDILVGAILSKDRLTVQGDEDAYHYFQCSSLIRSRDLNSTILMNDLTNSTRSLSLKAMRAVCFLS